MVTIPSEKARSPGLYAARNNYTGTTLSFHHAGQGNHLNHPIFIEWTNFYQVLELFRQLKLLDGFQVTVSPCNGPTQLWPKRCLYTSRKHVYGCGILMSMIQIITIQQFLENLEFKTTGYFTNGDVNFLSYLTSIPNLDINRKYASLLCFNSKLYLFSIQSGLTNIQYESNTCLEVQRKSPHLKILFSSFMKFSDTYLRVFEKRQHPTQRGCRYSSLTI